MKRLRAWFLAPTWVVTLTPFIAPLAIILAYSFLTRGTWGGIARPWSFESYQRLADPIYLGIVWRSFWIAGAATVLCLVLGFPLALFISRGESSTLTRKMFTSLRDQVSPTIAAISTMLIAISILVAAAILIQELSKPQRAGQRA